MNAAKFQACGYNFQFRKKDKWLITDVTSDSGEIPLLFDLRICEALQFILSRRMAWSVLEIWAGGKSTVKIRPIHVTEDGGRIPPPVQIQSGRMGDYSWHIFEKYLNHINTYQEEKFHRISRLVSSVIDSGEASIEAQALTLSVAV